MYKRLLTILLLTLIVSVISAEEAKESFFDKFGLVFNMENLLLDIDNYGDGYQMGMGGKYWINEKWAARMLLMIYHQSDEETDLNETHLGISGIAEYHFKERKLSPYLGGLVGSRLRWEDENYIDIYFGGVFGGELQVFKTVSAYAEYAIIAARDAEGFGVDLGIGNNAQIGIILYFK